MNIKTVEKIYLAISCDCSKDSRRVGSPGDVANGTTQVKGEHWATPVGKKNQGIFYSHDHMTTTLKPSTFGISNKPYK